jgi:hypothetical protein
MSLTKVSYSMITGAPANVLDYGADATGATDSTTAFQAALNTGKDVYIPNGTFSITELTMSVSQTVFGNGSLSVIKALSGSNALFTMQNGCTLRNFYINGNNQGQLYRNIATATSKFQLVVDSITVENWLTGFTLSFVSCQYVTVSNSFFNNVYSVVRASACLDFWVLNNYSNVNRFATLGFDPDPYFFEGACGNVIIDGNQINGSLRDGIVFEPLVSGSQRITISNNVIKEMKESAIWFEGKCTKAVVSNNTIENCYGLIYFSGMGVEIGGDSNDIVVDGNVVNNCLTGIYANGGSCTISNNFVHECTGYGITAYQDGVYEIIGNVCRGNGGGFQGNSITTGLILDSNLFIENSANGASIGPALKNSTITNNTFKKNNGAASTDPILSAGLAIQSIYNLGLDKTSVVNNIFIGERIGISVTIAVGGSVVPNTNVIANNVYSGITSQNIYFGTGANVQGVVDLPVTSSISYGIAAPVSGYYNIGSIVYNTAPASAGYIGWVCTVGGTPGTWNTFGLIS